MRQKKGVKVRKKRTIEERRNCRGEIVSDEKKNCTKKK